MELPEQSDKSLRTAKHMHDLSKTIMADGIKGLGQVNESGVEAGILIFTLLLQLPFSKYHIYCSTFQMEATLNLVASLAYGAHSYASAGS